MTLTAKNFCLVSNLNLSDFNFQPIGARGLDWKSGPLDSIPNSERGVWPTGLEPGVGGGGLRIRSPGFYSQLCCCLVVWCQASLSWSLCDPVERFVKWT